MTRGYGKGGDKVTPEQHWHAFNLGEDLQTPLTINVVWALVVKMDQKFYAFGEPMSLHESYRAGHLEAVYSRPNPVVDTEQVKG